MQHCKQRQCKFAEDGEEWDGFFEVEVNSKTIRFDGCPVSHMADDDLEMWMRCYRWLERWKMTPVTQGYMTPEQLDPRYYEAMEFIDSEIMGKTKKDDE